jgi:hypothetical protein
VNGLVNRLGQLEARFERLAFQVQALYGQVQALATQIAGVQQQTGGGQQGGGSGTIYWAHTPSSVAAATGSWPTLTPSTFTSDIYVDQAGTLTLAASSQTVRWFYKDVAAAGSLVPVEPVNVGGALAWNAIGNSCTAV